MKERSADRPIKILVLDKSGRADCALDTFFRSSRPKELFALSEVTNPGLTSKTVHAERGKTDDRQTVLAYAGKVRPDFVFIGPEEPLAAGVVDALQTELGIPAIGPTKILARIETSKSFTRELLQKFGIPGNPDYRTFRTMAGLREYLERQTAFVVKPDGLTGGKGVKVLGEHLHSVSDAVSYCEELFQTGQNAVVIEERLDGEEFSFQSFCDGHHIVHTIPVQDHKRAEVGDRGPNTGGMGSYSCGDHLLPFIEREHVLQASRINEAVAKALLQETGAEYKGILYGSFMLTRNGLRVIEYNARFGDPEIMNVLPLLKVDFIDVCESIIAGSLDKLRISFDHRATVCKYIVPRGYPSHPVMDEEIHVDKVSPPTDHMRLYYAAVNRKDGKLYLTGSRAVAIVGIGQNVAEAEHIAEVEAARIEGPVYHRRDIGTAELLARRIAHIVEVCSGQQPAIGQAVSTT
jgi:phosphoribosylamine--glycine ligase